MKTQMLSSLENGIFFKLVDSNILYLKLYNVLAKEYTLCFNFDNNCVSRLDKNKSVIPVNVNIDKYVEDTKYETE